MFGVVGMDSGLLRGVPVGVVGHGWLRRMGGLVSGSIDHIRTGVHMGLGAELRELPS